LGRFCKTCRQDAEACRAQAEEHAANGDSTALDAWQEAQETDIALRKLIKDFSAACPTRGQGKGRVKFDFVQFTEIYRKATLVSKDNRTKHMDYIDFIVYFTTKRMMTEEKAAEKWNDYCKDDTIDKTQDMHGKVA